MDNTMTSVFLPSLRLAAALVASMVPACAMAGTACPQHFAGGQAPDVTNPRMQPKTRELCYEGFALLHSGISRTALYSAERLTRSSVRAAREQVRVDAFHTELQLPAAERSELRDFSRSGYDRGHLSPSGDAASPHAQAETYTLANMVPQNPENNRGLWSEIESAVRELAQQRGELYVVTGPLFEGANLSLLKQRVLVPTTLFKLVYDPRSGRASAYVSPNDSRGTYTVVSLGDIERRAGMRLLPGAGGAREREPLALPPPLARRGGHRQHASLTGGHAPSGHPMYAVRHPLRSIARQLFR